MKYIEATNGKILRSHPQPLKNKKLAFEETDPLKNFTNTVSIGINDLLRRMTFEEYKKQWHLYEFPEDSYNKLKHLVKMSADKKQAHNKRFGNLMAGHLIFICMLLSVPVPAINIYELFYVIFNFTFQLTSVVA